MRIGSLFSGIGGLERGLEMAGVGTVEWQCEIDPYARAVLAKHWPTVKRYNDVRGIDESVERVDVICGGFPCQDISNAGKRAGIDGPRSGLWAEYARVLRVLRPSYVFVENVAALVNRGLSRVLGEMADLGYDAEWDVFSAAEVGAPHRRNRIFILAYAGRGEALSQWPRASRGGFDVKGNGGARSVANGNGNGKPASPVYAETQGLPGIAGALGTWPAEPDVGRVANGISSRMDRLKCLGNAVVPAQAALAFKTLAARIS